MFNVKIGGITYRVTQKAVVVPESRVIGHILYQERRIELQDTSPDVFLITLLHEILHGIVFGYAVRELRDENGNHLEDPINQLAAGLAEALGGLIKIPREEIQHEDPQVALECFCCGKLTRGRQWANLPAGKGVCCSCSEERGWLDEVVGYRGIHRE